jgi:hypothetical protein
MGTVSTWKWKPHAVIPLVVLVIVIVGVGGVLWRGAIVALLAHPISLPVWALILLAIVPACSGYGLWLAWQHGTRPKEMERRPLIVKGVRWRWWTEHNGHLRVVPYCEACDLQLRPRECPHGPEEVLPSFILHCNNCSHETDPFHGPLEDAPQLILDYFMQNLRKEFELSHHPS